MNTMYNARDRIASEVSFHVPTAELLMTETEDGGTCLCFEVGSSELTFAIPDDASVVYFVARRDGFRKAGIVLGEPGVKMLANWLNGRPFLANGLDVGGEPR